MIFHKEKRSVPLISRRLRPYPVDSSIITQCKCGLGFNLWNRKHHCRCCGEVFCYKCTEEQIVIPKILLGYLQTEGWWKEGVPGRICQECKKRIFKYDSCRIRLRELYSSPPRLDKIQDKMDFDALSYYLSTMSQIQYLFPGDSLTPDQVLFLKINRDLLHNHSYWAIQLLKIGPLSSLDSFIRHDETLTLCGRNCRPSLHLGNAVDMIVFWQIYSSSQKVAQQMIRTASVKELTPYVPVLVGSFRREVIDILVEKAKEDAHFSNRLYWALNVIGTSRAIAYRENILLDTNARGAINLRHLIGALDMGDSNLGEIITRYSIMDPFDPLHKITTIVKSEEGRTSSKPIFITYHTEVKESKRMMYKREDVRRDACITCLLKVLSEPLSVIKEPFPLISYEVIPVSSGSGLIELVENCRALSEVVNVGSMSNFLQNHNNDQTSGDLQSTYRVSLAFWTIITYIFGIGDRHFDNIMLSKQGMLFHIDYGFIFGEDSKPYLPQIRLNSYMIEGLGGNERYEEFKGLCNQIFMVLRQNMDLIYTHLLNLVSTEKTGVTENFIKAHLSKVFFIGETEEEAKSHLEFIIDNSRDALTGELNDYLHTLAKKTSGWLSWR